MLTGYTSKCRECVREENNTIYKPKNKPITKAELEEENKKLKEINESQNEEIQRFKDNAMQDMREITRLEEENKKLKETIKDHQLYEEKLEHRIIEFEELLH